MVYDLPATAKSSVADSDDMDESGLTVTLTQKDCPALIR